MARAARRSQKEIIQSKINKIEEDIAKLTEKLNKLGTDKKHLLKELSAIEALEREEEERKRRAEEEEKVKELISTMNDKGITFEDLKAMLENKE